MEMTIDKSIERLADYIDIYKVCGGDNYNPATNITKEDCEAFEYAIMFMKNYEARLKADMVALLEDLDLQIDESAAYNLEVAKVQRLIRDKINALKEQ